jgi:hypothetical protein
MRTLLAKTFKCLYATDLYLARVFHSRRLQSSVIRALFRHLVKAKQVRKVKRRVRDVTRLFRLKRLLKAWLTVGGESRIRNALKKEGLIKYCVKYSEYCKCEGCAAERMAQADIVPRMGTIECDEREDRHILIC